MRPGALEPETTCGGIAVAVPTPELLVEVPHTVVVEHYMGVDPIALAMLGELVLGRELAGAIVGLMFSGRAAREDLASTRARRELTALVQRAPKFARARIGDRIERVAIDRVKASDIVLVRTGELVPVDGALSSREAVIDTSALMGETLPVALVAGMNVLSGTANAGAPFELTADRPASEARTPRSCGWSGRPRRTVRRSSAWPTATPGSSCRPR
jgi:cation transport ATPase